MLGVVFSRDQRGQRKLVEIRLLEADRKCFHRLAGLQRHGRDHGRGIDSAAQERSQRNIGDQAHADGFVEDLAQPFARRRFGEVRRPACSAGAGSCQ